jgi:hypothetical protein
MQQDLACKNIYTEHHNLTTSLLAAKLNSQQTNSLRILQKISLPLHVHRLLLQAQWVWSQNPG